MVLLTPKVLNVNFRTNALEACIMVDIKHEPIYTKYHTQIGTMEKEKRIMKS